MSVYKQPANYAFNCHCGKNFNSKKNFYAHLRKVHDPTPTLAILTKSQNCALCRFSSDKSNMIKHLKTRHAIVMTEEKLMFPNKEDFLKWKNEKEKETSSKYIKKEV